MCFFLFFCLSLGVWLTRAGCSADPSKHFALFVQHVAMIRNTPAWLLSHITVFVERNLGFEAEHHYRELRHMENVSFYYDSKSERHGVLTTNEVKHSMVALTNAMLREGRVSIVERLVSRDPSLLRARLKEQLQVYSYQFKQAHNSFGRDAVALSGKIGGMKDDIVICLQLGILFSTPARPR